MSFGVYTVLYILINVCVLSECSSFNFYFKAKAFVSFQQTNKKTPQLRLRKSTLDGSGGSPPTLGCHAEEEAGVFTSGGQSMMNCYESGKCLSGPLEISTLLVTTRLRNRCVAWMFLKIRAAAWSGVHWKTTVGNDDVATQHRVIKTTKSASRGKVKLLPDPQRV